jgi:hypothetical protein
MNGKMVLAAAVQDEDVSSDSKNPKGKGAPKNGVFKARVPNKPNDDDIRKDIKPFYLVSKGTTHSVKNLGSKVVGKSNASRGSS